MIAATLITATTPGRLSKGFRLAEDGTLVKVPGGQLVDGLAESRRFASISAFSDALANLTPTNAMVYGTSEHDKARIVPQDQLAKIADTSLPVIARDRDHFRYPAGPAIMMIDHDTPKGVAEALSDDVLLEHLYQACPGLESAPHVVAQSASSFIYHGDRELIGQRGRRVYVLVADGRDIPRAGAVLFKRLQLAGLGHVEIGKAGQLLERGLIDSAVYQPERLDFCGGAACAAPLEQRRPAPRVINPDAAPMDTRATLPDLTPAEEAKRREIVAKIKADAAPEAAKRREVWAEEQVGRILVRVGKTPVSHPGDADRLREVYRNATAHRDLYGEFELVMADGETATVAEVLADPDRYHGQRLADPLEPDYGNDPRIAVLNLRAAGKPYIYSHAHGGVRYSLRRERRAHLVQAGERLAAIESGLVAMRGDGTLYERNAEIVRVTGEGAIVPLSQAGILLELDRLVRWQKYTKTGDITPCDCPRPVAEGVMAMAGKWGLPKLAAVTTAPLYHPRAERIIERDGFDAETGILVVCPDLDEWPGVPTNPTMEHVKEALDTIWLPFREFPFCCALDRGVLLAGALTAMLRPAYATAPGVLIVASTAGSGKTLLAKCLSAIAGEEIPSVMTGAEDDAEMRKRLVAVGRRGAAVIVLDNLTGYLDSDALCAWLTSEHLTDRVLGVSEDVMVRTGGLLLATGNNVTPKGDLCRRILTCRIEANSETPWKRSFDLNPVQYCRDHRLELVAAGLTVLRYYMNQPNPLMDRTASFEDWSDTVRRAVVGVGRDGLMNVADPVESIDAAYADDPETGKLRALLTIWNDRYGRKPMTIAEVRADADADENLKSALEEIAWDGRDINPRRLGRWIERNAGRIVDEMRFERGGKKNGVLIWQVKGGLSGFKGSGFPPTRVESDNIDTDGPEKTLKTPETPSPPPCHPQTYPHEVFL
jgi:hypothetical protein